MLLNSRSQSLRLLLTVAALLLALAAAAPLRAQSSEANYPTPVFASELSGRIAARDVGDARRTRHFYIFRGTEGDLIVNLETTELIGDVDVFTAAGFRPLVKFTLFGDPARLSKSFYLRKEETLVLRVEARAVGDVEGTYHITFGGSFLQAPPELANQTPPQAPTLSSTESRGTRRVTATGARIEEPRVEPKPTEETAHAEPTPAPTPKPERTTGRRTTTPRRGRGTRPAPSRSRPSETAAQPTTPESTEAKPAEEATSTSTPAPVEKPTPVPATSARRRAPRTPRRNPARDSAEARRVEPPAQPPADTQPEPAPAPTQRLIIVTKDGETLERDMSGVRRVTVENNQVVIVGRDGKITRRPLAGILKMSIEP
ncbi:MAG: hypothetical protein ACJ74T_13635 [Pyrinomonadaceae bacterium]